MNQAQEIMEWYVAAGVDTLLEDQPVNRFTEQPPEPRKANAGASKAGASAMQQRLEKSAAPPQPTSVQSAQNSAVVMPDGAAVEQAQALAAQANTLDALQDAIQQFEGCNLKRTAKTMVFADGNPNANIMFIGEPPDRDEDTQGTPFVGPAGALFDRMLASIGLDRTSAYMTTVLPWRPPGNRPPTPQEVEICRPFIERHIELASPEFVVLMGGHCAKTLMKADTTIMRLRGKWVDLAIGNKTCPAMATLHPAYLLQQPAQKKFAWQDLLAIKQRLQTST